MLLGEGEFRVRRSYSLKAKVSEKYGIFFSLFALKRENISAKAAHLRCAAHIR
jgi:hypothetical protein